MLTRALTKVEKNRLQKLGRKIRVIISEEKGYKSLDTFSLEYNELIARLTLYQIYEVKKDIKLSTLMRLSKALNLSLIETIFFF